ncbi:MULTISPECIES: GNAT family N-acetyltransferase [Bacillus]|uniref:GNAT family N-acetyltransferase n=1 Tax=Bacillus pumilus TaxID=1408 RepID=A0A2G8IS65_BACPU|nr:MULTISPECIES: GNAT family N-acetyltransferase [Bacillus]MCC9088513.1 GNAT family N-acetyltransferase [Bacillus pumilus]MED1747502.1 GNAT family N-acetyltransferase [Bacillus zhangzhouensis]PIK26311.1 GNAT family N-acetyltransferase [Bacillus pumilus]UUD42144.1 GNAT family N-acetyltransferase [Bacillus pumilus]
MIQIQPLPRHQSVPMDLLLLADPSKEKILAYVQSGSCYVAFHEQDMIGIYVLSSRSQHTVEMMNVAVKESWQGKGIGKQLIHHAIAEAKAAGFHTIEIGTGNSSIHQLALYQKCGFRLTSIDHDFFLKHYDEPIYENGIQCMDMVRLSLAFQAD